MVSPNMRQNETDDRKDSDRTDRDELIETLGDEEIVNSAEPVGPYGVRVKFRSTEAVHNLDRNFIRSGWHIDSINWEQQTVLVFPVPQEAGIDE